MEERFVKFVIVCALILTAAVVFVELLDRNYDYLDRRDAAIETMGGAEYYFALESEKDNF